MVKISCIITTHNNEHYLQESIESILNQSFQNFELVIVDDGSNQETEEIIAKYHDPRILKIRFEKNCGPALARNVALEYSTGKYIAIMDSDDVSMPNRFELQSNYLDEHQDIAILGTRTIRVIEKLDNILDKPDHPLDDGLIKASLILMNGSAMVHPSTMMRRDFLQKNRLFYPIRKVSEDHGLWVDALGVGAKFSNLKDRCLIKRKHKNNISITLANSNEPFKTALKQKYLGTIYPKLTYIQAYFMARIMEKNATIKREELVAGIKITEQIIRTETPLYGVNKGYLNMIFEKYLNDIKRVL